MPQGNLTTCADCGHTISITAKTCPNCGADIKGRQPNTLVVRRKSNIFGSAVALTVEVDGTVVGKLRNGEEISVEVSSGRHSVRVTAFPLYKSNTIYVDFEGNQVAKAVAYPKMTGWEISGER